MGTFQFGCFHTQSSLSPVISVPVSLPILLPTKPTNPFQLGKHAIAFTVVILFGPFLSS